MPIVISIFGIDGSGKSTVLFRLKGGKIEQRARIPETQLMLYDVGGSSKIRNIWQNYLAESHACIYVVDSSDPSRFSETSDALRKIYLDPRMKGKPLVM
ncbi:P-loop containing nucleoside triphosphate hydrolase protein [Obelidium mucronatum]|nr:P-loop containing nucleoside triphosphate hydrolase protein [Obelidium mucronatum]